jgi:hypothetical protein
VNKNFIHPTKMQCLPPGSKNLKTISVIFLQDGFSSEEE